MRITELCKSGRPTLSFEIYPARSAQAHSKLETTIDELVALEPTFMAVTFGAGGSTRQGSYELVSQLIARYRREVLAYFAGYGLSRGQVVEVIDSYRDLGVENLLAVRGDPPRDQPRSEPDPQGFAHASDLVAFLAPRYSFCLGVAGYPEGHVEATSREVDLDYLELKVRAGAEFIITNYFYDNGYFFEFCERCRARGLQVPILPGVMPIYSLKLLESLASTCGASIPGTLQSRLAQIPPQDKDAVSAFGIELAVEQSRELLQRGAPGIHIYTMDRSSSATEIVSRLRSESLL